jgi:hypothetical protein
LHVLRRAHMTDRVGWVISHEWDVGYGKPPEAVHGDPISPYHLPLRSI